MASECLSDHHIHWQAKNLTHDVRIKLASFFHSLSYPWKSPGYEIYNDAFITDRILQNDIISGYIICNLVKLFLVLWKPPQAFPLRERNKKQKNPLIYTMQTGTWRRGGWLFFYYYKSNLSPFLARISSMASKYWRLTSHRKYKTPKIYKENMFSVIQVIYNILIMHAPC